MPMNILNIKVCISLCHTIFITNVLLDKQAEIIAAWDLIITWLNPKSIVSEKPLVLKKQKSILSFHSDENMSLLPSLKILILIILQKGRLVELYGPNRSSVIYTKEEEDIKDLIQKEYKHMVSVNLFESIKD